MENKKFDKFIKRAMENLDGENYVPQDWDAMQEKLDADADGFDQFVAQSIANLDGEQFVPMNWELMENKLDADADSSMDNEINPEIEDIYLDAVAFDHLNNIEPPYNKEHWKIMSNRLDEEYAQRRRVIYMKVLEVAVVLLLVWTGINFFPAKKDQSNSQKPIASSINNHHNTNDLNLSSNPLISEATFQQSLCQ